VTRLVERASRRQLFGPYDVPAAVPGEPSVNNLSMNGLGTHAARSGLLGGEGGGVLPDAIIADSFR